MVAIEAEIAFLLPGMWRTQFTVDHTISTGCTVSALVALALNTMANSGFSTMKQQLLLSGKFSNLIQVREHPEAGSTQAIQRFATGTIRVY